MPVNEIPTSLPLAVSVGNVVSLIVVAVAFLVALPGIVFLLGKRWLRRKVARRAALGAFLAALGTLAFAGRWFGCSMCRFRYSVHVASLASAIWAYHSQYGPLLPATLEEIERTGLYGHDPYQAPASIWEDRNSGPAPMYLPVREWDGESGVIVAVAAKPLLGVRRGYVEFGGAWRTGYAEEQQLGKLLMEDNRLRERMGDPGRWELSALAADVTAKEHSRPFNPGSQAVK